MKRIRLFAFLAAICLILSNCNSASKNTSGSKPTPPVKETMPTLKYYTIGTPDNDLLAVNTELNRLLAQKLGIQIEYHKIDWNEYGSKLSTIIDSGSSFDIAFASSYAQGNFIDNAHRNVWLDLTPYLKNEGKDMYDAINPSFWKGVTINDRIYGVPTNKEVAVPEWWVYSKELVDKYDIDITKYHTLESLEPIFKTIKESEPDVTVMELDKQSRRFFALGGYEYISNWDLPLMVSSTDTSIKLINIFETDYATKTLETLRKYYLAGYINQDAAIRPSTGAKIEEVAFWRMGGSGPYADTTWSGERGSYDVLVEQVSASIVTTECIRGGIMVVNANSQYPKEAIEFLQCVNTDPEIRNLLNYGIENTHYKLTENGQVDIISDSYRGVQYTQGNWFILNTIKGDPLNKWDEFQRFNRSAIHSQALGFTPIITTKDMQDKIDAISAVTQKYFPGLMTGTVNPNVVLPQFLRDLEEAGIEQVRAEFQQQINSWKLV